MNKENTYTLYEGWRKLGIIEDLQQREVLEKQWRRLREQDSEFQKELRNRMKEKKAASIVLPRPRNSTMG